ncbi:uncharacterized protein LOC102674851 isoform X2 [Apis dorsata]|uniref:uncharacterized protein LOC102674851 isoform X2 n=1 Tax=Apis dorsata TaxID=7462 RepID=UPI0003DF669F|nr:uncharacterized protein LOC102674851 isoform X2 [Apis dorsata]
MVCPSINDPQSSISWDKTLQGIELHGPISIIHGNPSNLIFLVRGQQYTGNNTNNDQVDTDRSGKPDCIVVGNQGLLASIEPIAGTIHWSSNIHTFEKLPLILSDIDSDTVEDFLSIEIATKNNLVLLSGATGHLLGRYSPKNCSSIDINNHFNDTISYICYNNNGKNVIKTMTIKGLLHIMKLSEYKKKLIMKSMTFRKFKTLKFNEENNWNPTPYHYLSIENKGLCPGEFCKATVNLTLQKHGNQPIIIWDHVNPNSFVSKPAFLVMSGKPYTSGFVIKFWQWINSTSEHIEKVSIVTERRLVERVLIVFVNYTDVQIRNASQTDIIQLCRDADCQPNLNLRTRFSSIKIDCINEDGFPELITYWSSYDIEATKILTSKVQVVKLNSLVNLPHTN